MRQATPLSSIILQAIEHAQVNQQLETRFAQHDPLIGAIAGLAGIEPQYHAILSQWPWLRNPARDCVMNASKSHNASIRNNLFMLCHLFDEHLNRGPKEERATPETIHGWVITEESKPPRRTTSRRARRTTAALCQQDSTRPHAD